MTQCYDLYESVSTYTNYNHYESTILELSHFKKSGDYENGTRRYRCLDCGKAFSPLTGTVFDADKDSHIRMDRIHASPLRIPFPF